MISANRMSLAAGFFIFLLTGTVYTQVTSRLPAVKAQTGITDADLGLALMCMGAGSLCGFLTVNLVLKIMQVRTLLKIAATAFMLLCLCIAFAHNRMQILVLFALWGYACSYLDVGMNTHGIYLEMKLQRPCLASMHACYSLGCLLGSLLGSGFAFLAVPLWLNYVLLCVVLLLLLILLQGSLLPDPPAAAEADPTDPSAASDQASPAVKGAGLKRGFPYFVAFCGLMGLLSYTAEGSVAEWGSIVLHQAKAAPEGTAALAYGVFALFMAAARLCSDHLRSRLGDRLMIAGGALIAFVAMLVVILSPSPYLCLAAYALMGIGLAPIFPIALSNAGRSSVPPKTATAIVSLVGYSGLLVVPPLLGFLAEHFGLERALLLPLAAVAVIMAGSLAFKGRKQAGRKA